jgi:hypothetical protein
MPRAIKADLAERCVAADVSAHLLEEKVWTEVKAFVTDPGDAVEDAQAVLRARLEGSAARLAPRPRRPGDGPGTVPVRDRRGAARDERESRADRGSRRPSGETALIELLAPRLEIVTDLVEAAGTVRPDGRVRKRAVKSATLRVTLALRVEPSQIAIDSNTHSPGAPR